MVLIVRETSEGACPTSSERAFLLEELDLRPRRARLEISPREPLLWTKRADELPASHIATPFRPMAIRTVLNAARTAAASEWIAWQRSLIEHNAIAMSTGGRQTLFRTLTDDPTMTRFADRALRGLRQPVRRRDGDRISESHWLPP